MAEGDSIQELPTIKKGDTLLLPDEKQKLGRMLENSHMGPWDAIGAHIRPKSDVEFLEKALDGERKDLADAMTIIGEDFRTFSVFYPIQTQENNPLDEKKKNISDFIVFELGIMGKALKKIDREVDRRYEYGNVPYFLDNALKTVSFMATTASLFGDNASAEAAIDFLLKHCSKASFFVGDFPLFFSILECGNTTQIEKGKKILIKALLQDDDLGKFAQEEIVDQSVGKPWIVSMGKREQFLEKALSLFGLNSKETLKAWNQTNFTDGMGYRAQFAVNFNALVSLERWKHGIGKFLQKEFGVNDLARYPERLLIDQYDSRATKDDMPYGVIIYPQSDWNGAFYEQKEIFKKLFNQTEGRCKIIVWEVKDVLGLIGALNKSRHRYGPISFAIIGGHGTSEDIEFSPEETLKGKLTKKQVGREGASAVALAFIDNPTIILNSCSTGHLQGIGRDISKIGKRFPLWLEKIMSITGIGKDSSEFRPTIIAPPEPASIKNINVRVGSNAKIDFRVEYGENSPSPQVYKGGVLQK